MDVRAGSFLSYPGQPRACEGTAVNSWSIHAVSGHVLFAPTRFEQERPHRPTPSAGELGRQPSRAPREKTKLIIVPAWSIGQPGTLNKFIFGV